MFNANEANKIINWVAGAITDDNVSVLDKVLMAAHYENLIKQLKPIYEKYNDPESDLVRQLEELIKRKSEEK